MLESDVIERIRRIFLQVRPYVSIRQAAWLLGWTWEEMQTAVAEGMVDLTTTPLGKWFGREELFAKALEAWPLEVIEDALGDEAARILPQALRTAELRVRLPRFQIDMLRYFARQEATTVSVIVSGELEHLANANLAELSANVPGFGEAAAWPG
jgi:hypothetical protein